MSADLDKALRSLLADAAKSFSKRERRRFLARAHYAALPAAQRLKEKHAWAACLGLDSLNVTNRTLRNELSKGYIRLLPEVGDHDERPVVVLTVRNFKPAATLSGLGGTAATHLSTSSGSVDGTSSVDDAILCVAYTMQHLLRELDELDPDVDGGVFLVDCGGCSVQNLSQALMERILRMLRAHYPGVCHQIYVVNTSRVLEGVAKFVRTLMGSETQAKVLVLSPEPHQARAALLKAMPPGSFPRHLGGELEWLPAERFLAQQAETEGVDLAAAEEERAKRSELMMMGGNVALNGMQSVRRFQVTLCVCVCVCFVYI